uniref:Mannose-6-phosphate isomerase n=1 Tax=Caenorhabditis japonica TaxID=281687 RepID=A0A8R1DH98_CAEJA
MRSSLRGNLSFLFKVLSVSGPLSIQIHPTKAQGKLLHTKDPKNYPDDNHKPEIAIALTEFELLSGFRQHSQISDYLKLYSEIQDLLSDDEKAEIDNLGSYGESSARALKKIFSRIWQTPKEKLQVVVDKLARRIQGQENKSALEEVIVYLFGLYPGDVGVFAPIFLNYFKLQPGEATFLEPNMPHAYLKGDCVECMADSDNTIRAGLTPKYIDVESLVEMLNYDETLLPKYVPNTLEDGSLLFTPHGIDEFWVQEVKGPAGSSFQLPYSESCSVLTVLNGSASIVFQESTQSLSRGEVVFIGATNSADRPKISVSDDFLAFRAFTPSPRALENLQNKNLVID